TLSWSESVSKMTSNVLLRFLKNYLRGHFLARINQQRQQPAQDVETTADEQRCLPAPPPLQRLPDRQGTEPSAEIPECVHAARHGTGCLSADVVTDRPRRADAELGRRGRRGEGRRGREWAAP